MTRAWARRPPQHDPDPGGARSRRNTTIALFLAGFAVLFNLYTTQPILPVLADQFGVTAAAAAATITATTLAVALTAPLAGALSDRFGRRRLTGSAILAMALPTIGCASATGLPMLLVLRFAQGLLIPLVFTSAVAYAQEESPPGTAARANAIYISGSVLGGFSGRFLTGLVTGWIGWRPAFVLLAVVTLVVGVGVLGWLPPEQRFTPADGVRTSLHRLGGHLRAGPLLATCLLGGCLLFGQVAAFTYAGFHLAAAPYRFAPGALGAVFAVFLLGAVVTPIAGSAIERVGHGRVLVVAVALSCAGLTISQLPSPVAVVAGLGGCSTGTFIGQACATNVAARATPGTASSGVGLYITCFYLGGGLGALVPAPIWRALAWPGCAALIGTVLLTGLGIALPVWYRAGLRGTRCRSSDTWKVAESGFVP